MCRIGSIKSKIPVQPSTALKLMLPQQEGHDNSGFAMVMQDLYGIFSGYKDKPLLSMACTQRGAQMVEDYMDAHNFVQLAEWIPIPAKEPGLDIQAMPYYIFRNYDYPEHYGGGIRVFLLARCADAEGNRRPGGYRDLFPSLG